MANYGKYGDPRKRSESAPVAPTSASAWVSNTSGEAVDLQLPSGNVARVRQVGPEAFLTQGLMPDSLSPIIEKAIHSKKGLKPQQQASMASDPQQIGALLEMLDRTLVYAVVEPTVCMPPGCEVCGEQDSSDVKEHDPDYPGGHEFEALPRNPDVLYADRVDLEDKMFVMNFAVGGTRDLERFRGQLGAGVGSIPARKTG